MLQAETEADSADGLAQGFEFRGWRQMTFVDFQCQQRAVLRVLLEQIDQTGEAGGFAQRGRRQAQGQRLWVLCEIHQTVRQHCQVEACGPAKAFDPG